MKASLILLLTLAATLMISEFIVCDFGAGTTRFYFGPDSTSISSVAFPSNKKATISVVQPIQVFTCNLWVMRNGEIFSALIVNGGSASEIEVVPDKAGDVFTLKRKDILDICDADITMQFKDKTSTDLPSSSNNLVATLKTNGFTSTGTYKMIVPRGMKYTGSVHISAGGKLKVATSAGNFFTFEVGLLSLLGADKALTLVAPSDVDELFTLTLTDATSGGYYSGNLEATSSADTPSRTIKEATPPDATGIAIGVIVGIIACCCISCIAIGALVFFITKRNNFKPGSGVTVVTTGATGTTVVNV